MSVLEPWNDIKVNDSENKYSIEVWGRVYTFEDSIFPTSIESCGQELLFEPISLNLEFEGKAEKFYNIRHDIIEKSEEKVVVCSSALCGNIIINASQTFEYDGFINISTRLVPCGIFDMIRNRKDEKDIRPILNRAELSVKMNKTASGLFHFWPNTDSSVLVRDVINSGAFFETKMPFKPCLWIGNEKCGLNFCMESDKNIQVHGEDVITTVSADEYNEIKILLLDSVPKEWENREEIWLAPLTPISYDFIFEATPVKKPFEKLNTEWRAYHAGQCEADIEVLHKQGVKWVIFHEGWSLIQNYCLAENENKLREYIEKCHSYGIKFMVYFGYEYSSAMTDFDKNKDSYLNKDAEGKFTGGWTRQNTYQKAFVTCYNGGYSDEMIEGVIKALDYYGVDGIYTDGTYVPWECANEAHGCGYRDEDGKLHVIYPIKAVRTHVKKMYKAVHDRGGIIDTHQSSCCMMPTLAFCDTYFDGENIQGNFSKNLDTFLNMEAFRCEYMGENFGIIPNFIAYLRPPEYNIRNVLSIALIHDVGVRPFNEDALSVVSKIWQAKDRIGENAQRKMYWEKTSAIKCEDNKNVYISSFETSDRLLAAVSKFSSQNGEEEFILPDNFTKAHELLDDVYVDIVDGKMKYNVEKTKAYLFEIT